MIGCGNNVKNDTTTYTLEEMTIDRGLQGLTLHVDPDNSISFFYLNNGIQADVHSPYSLTYETNGDILWHRVDKDVLRIGVISNGFVLMCRGTFDRVCDARFGFGQPQGDEPGGSVAFLQITEKS